jgi:DNA-directed RNA polymerase specialized sigma24 family protein
MSPPDADPSDDAPALLLADPVRGRAAFDQLYDRHAVAVLAFAHSRFRHLAEDLCQTAWVEAIQHKWKPGDNVRAWLFRVVNNKGVSILRKQGRSSAGSLPDVPGPPDEPIGRLLGAERVDRVKRCRE